MDYGPIIILAIAVSIDGFVVGITYGLKEIQLGIFTLPIISGISAGIVYIMGNIGEALASGLRPGMAENIGGFILMGIGFWMILNVYSETLLSYNPQLLTILHEPVLADLDDSGIISPKEAFLLGLALATDAIGAGLGVGLTGFKGIKIPLIIGLANFILVSGGFLCGKKIGNFIPDGLEVLPGIIIMFIGIIRII